MTAFDLPGVPVDDETGEPKNLLMTVVQYLSFRRGRESLLAEENTLKADLMDSLAGVEADENGHRFYYFDADPKGVVTGVKRERRVSQVLDEDAAMAVVEKYHLQDSCLETITVLSEDKLLAANFAGVIPDEEMKALYSDNESFALILLKDKR